MRERIKNLIGGAMDSTPQNIDWSEAMGDDCEGWQSFDAAECDKCHKVYALTPGEYRCHECDESGESECDGYLSASEPMMSYYYPCPIDDPQAAAIKLVNLPLCVVQFRDGRTALALTGGGMDLTWEICEAFMRLGMLPPVHFCRVPQMCGRGTSERDKWILAGCRATIHAQMRSLRWQIRDLKRTAQWASERAKKG